MIGLLSAGALASALVPDPSRPLVASGAIVEFTGACDASGAVTLEGGTFVVGDDEDNVLRVYDAAGGAPVMTRDLSRALALPSGKRRFPELDIEAATAIGDISFWLTSHGRTSKGADAPSRQIFFATKTAPNGAVELVGAPYTGMREDLIALPSLARFDLRAAAERAPKADGGFNLEGMTATHDGKSLWIGFRNPVPGGKTLLLRLLNPFDVITGAKPKFAEPLQLSMGGLGIRSISWWRGRYLLVGGSPGEGGVSRLFSWTGRSKDAPRPEPLDLADFNPEAFATFEDRDEFLLLSDDGSRTLEGSECKKLRDVSRKRFRGVWVRASAGSR